MFDFDFDLLKLTLTDGLTLSNGIDFTLVWLTVTD